MDPVIADEGAACPEDVMELSESCRGFVLRAVGVELDYTPETLPLLDHYLAEARGGIDARPEVLELVLRAAGAYFGEVARRHLGGFWRRSGADAYRWQVCLTRVVLAFNPAGVVRDVLGRGSVLAGPPFALQLDADDRELVEEKLALLPPVSEDEYHLTSTRLEALEVAQATLLERMQRDGLEPLELTAEDYDDPPDAA